MSDWTRVVNLSIIPTGEMRSFLVGDDRILIARPTDDNVIAAIDECTHQAVRLSDGEIEGNEIECPAHGARYDLLTGNVTAPPALTPLLLLPLKIEDNEIFVKLDS